MQKNLIRGGIVLHNGREAVTNFVESKMTEERGEIGSWLILAAGLAVVAGFVATQLDGWLRTKVGLVTQN